MRPPPRRSGRLPLPQPEQPSPFFGFAGPGEMLQSFHGEEGAKERCPLRIRPGDTLLSAWLMPSEFGRMSITCFLFIMFSFKLFVIGIII